MIRRRITIFASVFALALAATAVVAYGQTPDRRGEVATDSYTYKGTTASAPIPADQHIRNEGGSDGAGICVVTTGTVNGRFQGVPGLERGRDSLFWQTAKHRPGGHGPDKLGALIKETLPGVQWSSTVTTDPSILDELSRKGVPIASTMRYGQGYPGTIHHDVSVIEYRTDGMACIVDSNFPGQFHWMPAAEFARRSIDGGSAWYWWFDYIPAAAQFTPQLIVTIIIVGLLAVLLLMATTTVVVFVRGPSYA